MIICSAVVEKSTFETRYWVAEPPVPGLEKREDTAKSRLDQTVNVSTLMTRFVLQESILAITNASFKVIKNSRNLTKTDVDAQIIWLQQRHFVSDQSFDSYIIFADGQREQFLTSHRKPLSELSENIYSNQKLLQYIARTKFEFFTAAGSSIGLAGFVLQFQAFRGNWSTSIAQLIAVSFMTTMRALVRRGLTVQLKAEEVMENHEKDWLALGISTMPKFWNIYTGGNQKFQHRYRQQNRAPPQINHRNLLGD
ncbi:Similar to hypothetical protein [Tuber melanosporum Mel28]; acc. no. XP_002841911 [Pyronema omphalodes CBS 100304]|uniref:Uncharacterized protein n=1 Tax=Pyronema omphalodes (strain CBS 100304) TaxID=1076935 RepID=U4LN03_PYROM|nr:Similar to hypothetical protein [Tuber melanosporum Mel28]; acc. no. XP_002841911 [Pyronema omphalodes CBS 100304]